MCPEAASHGAIVAAWPQTIKAVLGKLRCFLCGHGQNSLEPDTERITHSLVDIPLRYRFPLQPLFGLTRV